MGDVGAFLAPPKTFFYAANEVSRHESFPRKNIFFCRKHFFAIFCTFFEISKSGFSRFGPSATTILYRIPYIKWSWQKARIAMWGIFSKNRFSGRRYFECSGVYWPSECVFQWFWMTSARAKILWRHLSRSRTARRERCFSIWRFSSHFPQGALSALCTGTQEGQKWQMTDIFEKSILRTAVFRVLRGIPAIRMLFSMVLFNFCKSK